MERYSVMLKNEGSPGWHQSTWLLWIIICWGSLLRLAQYLSNRSLWLDESMLALNIASKDFAQLMRPLEYGQSAPPGFLIAERLAVQLFGTSEYSLRFFPLICGIASLVLFGHLAKRTVPYKAVPIALGLFAISGPLIYFSSELKQYSSDVVIAIGLCSAAMYYESRTLTPWRIAVFGVLGAVSIWFSHSSVFVLAGLGISLAFLGLAGGQWARIGSLAITYSLWVMSFAACYFISLRHLAGSKHLSNYFSFAFVPYPLLSVSAMEWLVDTFFEMFKNPGGLELSGLAAFTFVVGCISMVSQKRRTFLILMSPVGIALLAAGFHKYPFAGRLILFLVPAFLLLIAEGVEHIRSQIKSGAHLIAFCMIGLLMLHPVLDSIHHLLKPRVREEIKPVMSHIKERQHAEDVLYVYHGAVPAFRYYATGYGLDIMPRVQATSWENTSWNEYEQDIERLRGHRRVWLLFSHSRTLAGEDEEKVFLYLLDRRGARLDSFKSAGAAAYLYQMTNRETVDE